MIRWFFCLVLLILPGVTEAAIVISEIAWMGSVNSANDEWIELHNTGSDQSVDGWTLSDGINLNINLVGTIGADQYAVLERTDDDSALGTAFLIYTGALSNAGVTLTLRDSDGNTIDQIAGGEDWSNVGGDNVTKETAQLTSSGWITANGTPGVANTIVETVADTSTGDENETETEADTSSASDGTSVTLVLPDHTLRISLDIPNQVYVNQPVDLSVIPIGIGSLVESLAYRWNYGDGEIGQGKEVAHTYFYPGQYVVVVDAAYARHEAQIRKQITVLPVSFSITRNSRGDVQIHNDAKYEIDLSGYVVQGLSGIKLPPNTFLLPNATLTIPAKKISAHQSSLVALIDPEKTVVAFDDRRQTTIIPPLLANPQTVSIIQPSQTSRTFVEPVPAEVIVLPEPATGSLDVVSPRAAVSESGSSIPRNSLPYLGLIGVLALGFGAIMVTKNKAVV